MTEPRIVFMGTPEFAVTTLKALLDAGKQVVGVITVPDKPAGRGQQLQESAVKKFAMERNIQVLQPVKLKDPSFLEELKALRADLQIVVAFRMLPEVVFSMPRLGTFNLHASLLPHYRGAAPINWAVINGERKSGVTTFFLDKEIDTGKVIYRKEVEIDPDDTAGCLHDKLMVTGAELVVKTVDDIRDGKVEPVDQETFRFDSEELKHAPKLFRETCRIKWDEPADHVFNFIRGLSPYPAAYTELVSPDGAVHHFKIYFGKVVDENGLPGTIRLNGNKHLVICCGVKAFEATDVQIAGKKRMLTPDFLRGFTINENWKVN